VLLDAASPFGNGYLLPGDRYENPSRPWPGPGLVLTGLSSHATRCSSRHPGAFPDKPVLTASIIPVSVTAYPEGGTMRPRPAPPGLDGLCRLARPGVFTATLEELG